MKTKEENLAFLDFEAIFDEKKNLITFKHLGNCPFKAAKIDKNGKFSGFKIDGKFTESDRYLNNCLFKEVIGWDNLCCIIDDPESRCHLFDKKGEKNKITVKFTGQIEKE